MIPTPRRMIDLTHGLDAPYHFIGDGRTIEQVALEQCAGPALLLSRTGREASPVRAIAVAW